MTSEGQIRRRIRAIKAELTALGDLRPGSISAQYKVCDTPGCRCKADPPRKHGPYYQLSYTRHGRGRTESVHAEDLPDVQAQLRTYHKLRDLVEEWGDLSIDLDRLRRTGKP